jgi:serine-type D-Ala-D-Ala carboxypeptidase/endopeptidase
MPSPLPARTIAPLADDSTILRIIRERVIDKRSAGIVVGVIDPDGRRRIVACGDPGPGQLPLDPDSVFEIGSITKVFTTTLLAEMVERGEVRLDDPVGTFLPGTVRMPARGGRAITLLDLATHTSGLPRLPINLEPRDIDNPLAEYRVKQLYAFLSGYELPRDVGSRFEYSNLGLGLLGHALALGAGKTYEALLQERILVPLGLTKTAITLAPAAARHVALPHGERGEIVPRWDSPTLAGSGAILSTTADMLRFAAANLGSSGGSLQRATANARMPRQSVAPNRWIGLAWNVSRHFDRDISWKNGGTGGSHAFLGLDPTRDTAVVVLSNSVSSIDDIGFHLLDARLLLAKRDDRSEITLAPEVLARYVGVYQLTPSTTLSVAQTPDGLTAEQSGFGAAPIYAQSETEFFVKAVDLQVTFERDSAGTVTGLVAHRAGTHALAKKIT